MEETVTIGSGNVFSDLGFENAAELQAKAALSICIEDALGDGRWTLAQAANRTGLTEGELEQIVRGDLDTFSPGRLIDCLNQLDRDVEIRITPSTGKRGCLTVAAGSSRS